MSSFDEYLAHQHLRMDILLWIFNALATAPFYLDCERYRSSLRLQVRETIIGIISTCKPT